MSIKATNFVRGLRGLTPTEKTVAFVIADHVNHKTELCTAGMTTIAEESGLAARQVASRVADRLVTKGVLIAARGVSRGRVPTQYRMNYDSANRNLPVAVNEIPTATLEHPQPQLLSVPTATGELQEGFEGVIPKGEKRDAPPPEVGGGVSADTTQRVKSRSVAARTTHSRLTTPSKSKPNPKSKPQKKPPVEKKTRPSLDDPRAFLEAFAKHYGYSLVEADGRLAWHFARIRARKSGGPIRNPWKYLLKADAAFDEQRADAPGGVGPLIEKGCFSEMFGFELESDVNPKEEIAKREARKRKAAGA